MRQLVLLILVFGEASGIHAGGFDRVNINVGDPQAAAHWYAVNLGGRLTTVDSGPGVAFGKITLSFSKRERTIGESTGSGLDHLGFSYQNLDAVMQRFAKSGVRIVSGIEKDGPVRYAFIHDPWAKLIEVVEDPEIRGFHHIHLASDNPKTTLKWYTDVFGGRVGRFAGLIGGIRYGDTWVLVKGVARPPAPTKGRALDHLVWPVADFDASVKRLEATNARIETRPADSSLFVVSPDSVQLKLERRVAE